jgi:hypothetical protein
LNLEYDEIEEFLETFDKQSRAIKEEALKMSWFMRGGISYEDAMALSQQERELIGEIVKKNMETTKESGLPFF